MKGVICILLLFCSLQMTVFAEDPVKDLYSSLPDGITDEFPKDFGENISSDGASAVSRLDARYIFSFVSKTIKASLSDLAQSVGMLIFIVIVSSIMLSFSDGIPYKPMLAVSSFAVIGCLIEIVKPLCDQVGKQLDGTGAIMKLSLPVMTALCGTSGQPSSAAVNAVWLNTALALTEQLAESILSPLISVCIVLIVSSSISRLNGNNSLNGTVNAVKKTFVFSITAICTIFTAIMSFQNVIAKGNDTVLLRSVKLVSGSAIPVIGGALSEAAGSYLSSVSLLKSSLGMLCAVCIIVSTLPLIIRLFALKIALLFSAFISDVLGGAVSNEIKEFISVLDLLISISVLCSVIFIVAVGVFASTLPV